MVGQVALLNTSISISRLVAEANVNVMVSVPVTSGINLYQTSVLVDPYVNVLVVVVAATNEPDVVPPFTTMLVALAHKSFAGGGVGIANEFEITLVKPGLLNIIFALVTAAVLVAVRPLNVDTPAEAATDDVPFNVHVKLSATADTIPVLAVILLYWSSIFTLGWVANTPPFVEGAVG